MVQIWMACMASFVHNERACICTSAAADTVHIDVISGFRKAEKAEPACSGQILAEAFEASELESQGCTTHTDDQACS